VLARGAGQTNVSFGAMPPGQQGPADGPVALSDPPAPWPSARGAVSDAVSAPTNATYDRTFNSAGPIDAFRLADAGLRTAARDYALGQAGTPDLGARVDNDSPNQVDPLGLCPSEMASSSNQSPPSPVTLVATDTAMSATTILTVTPAKFTS
jgi:hypothetical protein